MAKSKIIIRSGKGDNYPFLQDHCFIKTPSNATKEEGIVFIEDTLKPGFHLGRHYHKVMTEIFYILKGELELKFDDETVIAKPGDTVTVPPYVWHEAQCKDGGKMLSIFYKGNFDKYLKKLESFTDEDFKNADLMKKTSEEFDVYDA